MAKRLTGFDCHVLAYDPFADLEFARQYSVIVAAREAVIEQADFLSLHLPLVPETRNTVNDDFFSHMKPGSFLINTSRGEVVDENALYRALKSGHLGGAALDAFREEPPDPNHPLLSLPQVIATPHLGAQTDGAINTMGWMAFKDCLAVLRGEPPAHMVRS